MVDTEQGNCGELHIMECIRAMELLLTKFKGEDSGSDSVVYRPKLIERKSVRAVGNEKRCRNGKKTGGFGQKTKAGLSVFAFPILRMNRKQLDSIKEVC